jgi:hypothetical protein
VGLSMRFRQSSLIIEEGQEKIIINITRGHVAREEETEVRTTDMWQIAVVGINPAHVYI